MVGISTQLPCPTSPRPPSLPTLIRYSSSLLFCFLFFIKLHCLALAYRICIYSRHYFCHYYLPLDLHQPAISTTPPSIPGLAHSPLPSDPSATSAHSHSYNLRSYESLPLEHIGIRLTSPHSSKTTKGH